MLTTSTFEFIKELKQNNNRDWFAENKKRFDIENKSVKIFFTEVLAELEKSDSIEKMQMHRIYRDIRFSKDKTPYKAHFSVSYDRTKPLLRGGMYLHIEDGASFVGGGFWEPNNEDLLRIRKELELDASELKSIIADTKFIHFFKNGLEGEGLKTAPKGFDKNHPDIELIRKKQFVVRRKFTNKEVLATSFKEEVIQTFLAMRPFFDYMSDVLTTDLNGESLY